MSEENREMRKKLLLSEFQKLDKDKSGHLEVSEVKQWLHDKATEVLTITEEDVIRLIALVDNNFDGKISFEEFVQLADKK